MKIVKTPNLCGGRARIYGTHLAVWVIELARQVGLNTDEIMENYPLLNERDIIGALRYADQNRDEIEKDIAEEEKMRNL